VIQQCLPTIIVLWNVNITDRTKPFKRNSKILRSSKVRKAEVNKFVGEKIFLDSNMVMIIIIESET
jgi:hypothetical protein